MLVTQRRGDECQVVVVSVNQVVHVDTVCERILEGSGPVIQRRKSLKVCV